jgi:Uri superfamily endonuclease
LRLEKKLHWHVDYLIRSMPVVAVGWRIAEERYECLWSRRAVEQWGAEVPALGLGASDCREKCPAHLLYLSGGEEDLAYLWQEMEIWKLG